MRSLEQRSRLAVVWFAFCWNILFGGSSLSLSSGSPSPLLVTAWIASTTSAFNSYNSRRRRRITRIPNKDNHDRRTTTLTATESTTTIRRRRPETTAIGHCCSGLPTTRLFAASSSSSSNDNDKNNNNGNKKKKKAAPRSKKTSGKTNKSSNNKAKSDQKPNTNSSSNNNTKSKNKKLSKQELVQAVGASMKQVQQSKKKQLFRQSSQSSSPNRNDINNENESKCTDNSDTNNQKNDSNKNKKNNLLDRLNPFSAGQQLRQTLLDTAVAASTLTTTTPQPSIYHWDDRISLSGNANPFSDDTEAMDDDDDDYIPEVLVVHALSPVGQLVVQRLLRAQRARVRVLVPNLFSDTLSRLGTGVTYSPGDLSNLESLEYAVTDVDKIVYCPPAAAAADTDGAAADTDKSVNANTVVDGMKNLVQAYQNVRHADYGNSQAAKRTLFKFSRVQDFDLFEIIDDAGAGTVSGEEEDDDNDQYENVENYDDPMNEEYWPDEYNEYNEYSEYEEDEYDDHYSNVKEESMSSATATTTVTAQTQTNNNNNRLTTTQVQWIRNKFDHAVFVGRLPRGAQAAIQSGRLRSREQPDQGIDLSTNFAGFILRVCSDGRTYHAVVQTSVAEYVCDFTTVTKRGNVQNKSRNKFTTVRLPFDKFRPVLQDGDENEDDEEIPPFTGQDVQHLGFRHSALTELESRDGFRRRGSKNKNGSNQLESFYLAFSYVKLFRSQPEPEFVHVSDARIPPIVTPQMVQHEAQRLDVSRVDSPNWFDSKPNSVLLRDFEVETEPLTEKEQEQVYFTYVSEEILKRSGLAYAMVRVQDCHQDTGSITDIELSASGAPRHASASVTPDQIAQICVAALMEPHALNKCFYVGTLPSTGLNDNDNLSRQFQSLPKDPSVML